VELSRANSLTFYKRRVFAGNARCQTQPVSGGRWELPLYSCLTTQFIALLADSHKRLRLWRHINPKDVYRKVLGKDNATVHVYLDKISIEKLNKMT